MRLIGQFTGVNWANDEVQIPIAFYHRVALGLETGTAVYIAPARHREEGDTIDELIVTTFDPAWWKSMYRLSLRMEERHGAVASALECIKQCGANIGILETITTEAGEHGTHHVLAFIHVADAWRKSQLEDSLSELAKDKDPNNFSVMPLERLKACPIDTTRPPLKVVMRKKQLEIDATLFLSLIGARGVRDEPRPTRTLIYSDTEEKFVQCYFPKRDEVMLAVSVPHRETVGALFSFTEPISRHRANILNSYSRLVQANDTAEWKAIIDVTAADCKVQELLNEIRRSPLAHDFSSVTLSYIERYESQRFTIPALPTAQDCVFTGRTDEVNAILAGCVREDPMRTPSSFLVNGFSKTGKTALLNHLKERLEEGTYSAKAWCISHIFQEVCQQAFWQSLLDAVRRAALEAGGHTANQHSRLSGENQFGIPANQEESSAVDAYEAFVDFVSKQGKTLVVLLDEAAPLLHPSQDYTHEANAILKQIKHFCEAGPKQGQNARISWVLADEKSWDHSDGPSRVLLGQFDRKNLHPLSDEDARELTKKLLEVKPYELWADHLQRVYRRITVACGNQPFYIELVRQALVALVNKSPAIVNIIDSSMIEKALVEVATGNPLHDHFHATFSCLCKLCDSKYLHALITGRARVNRRKLLKSNYRNVDLAAFPGIRCEASSANAPVRCVELMRIWAKAKDPHQQKDSAGEL